MSFRDLFALAKGRAWTPDEERAFAALTQDARNHAVRDLAREATDRAALNPHAPRVYVQDRRGTDGLIYTAFWTGPGGSTCPKPDIQ